MGQDKMDSMRSATAFIPSLCLSSASMGSYSLSSFTCSCITAQRRICSSSRSNTIKPSPGNNNSSSSSSRSSSSRSSSSNRGSHRTIRRRRRTFVASADDSRDSFVSPPDIPSSSSSQKLSSSSSSTSPSSPSSPSHSSSPSSPMDSESSASTINSSTSSQITSQSQLDIIRTSTKSSTAPNEAEQPKDGTALKQAIVPIKIGPLSFSIPARSLLYIVPFLWGSFGPSVRFLFSQHPHQEVSVFNSERLLLSTLVYVPILFHEFQILLSMRKKESSPDVLCVDDDGKESSKFSRFDFLPKGLELGIYVFIANIAQVLGLQQTSASRAAFLIQLQTVFVPVLGTLLGTDSISLTAGFSSTVAVAGVLLLSLDKSAGTQSSLTGDSLEVLSAVFFSLYIVRLSKVANKVAPNPLVATKIAVQAFLSIGWATITEFQIHAQKPVQVVVDSVVLNNATDPWTLGSIGISVAIVIWTGLLSSAFSGWAQTKGQQAVPANEAALIFATQPLWATAIAAVVLGESFGSRGFAGGGLIIMATLIPTIAEYLTKKKNENNQR